MQDKDRTKREDELYLHLPISFNSRLEHRRCPYVLIDQSAPICKMDLDAVPPPPLGCQDALRATDENQCIETSSEGNKAASVVKLQSTSNASTENQIQSAMIQSSTSLGQNVTVTSCPHKTPVSITKCIQAVQTEVGHINNNDVPSPRTPCNTIASPDFLDYIRSTEKELDMLLKETLASPTSSIRNNDDSMDISLEASLDELKKDLSFQEQIDFNAGSVESKCSDITISVSISNMERIAHSGNVKSKVPPTNRREAVRKHSVSPVCMESSKSGNREKILAVNNHFRRGKMLTICKIVLPLCFMMTFISFLLGNIYPATPLLISDEADREGQWTLSTIQRFQLGFVTVSFGIATSLRTIMAAPLQRLDAKLKTNGMDSQVVSRILNLYNQIAATMEKRSCDVWENIARQNHVLKDDSLQISFMQPPQLDLGMNVPCDAGEARTYIISGHLKDLNSEHDGTCFLRDLITHELLMEFAATNFDSEFSLETHPLILRNLWPKESLDENSNNQRRLSPRGIVSDPQLSNFILPNYFSDATRSGYDALVPDSDRISLSQFVKNIQSGKTPYAKIGTQSIVEEIPALRDEIVPSELAKELFGWNPWLDELREKALLYLGTTFKRFVKAIPPSTYFPIFIAGLKEDNPVSHSRTDLHTEPIGNIAVQLHGTRTWTLLPSKLSGLLRPSVSKHGRGKSHIFVSFSISVLASQPNCIMIIRLHIFYPRSDHRIAS